MEFLQVLNIQLPCLITCSVKKKKNCLYTILLYGKNWTNFCHLLINIKNYIYHQKFINFSQL